MQVPEGFSVIVIAFDDRHPRPARADLALQLNQRYAERFGISFQLLVRSAHTRKMPACWTRVALVADAHRQASRDPDARGFVIGLHADAVFASLSYDLRQELVEVHPSKAAVVVREALFHESGSTLSSSFFGVRIGPAGEAFLQEWLAGFTPGSWHVENGAWRPLGAASAGDTCEQGRLNHVAAGHADIVCELPQYLLNSAFPRPVTGQQNLVLPGILHCMPWPGEDPGEHEARACAAFRELLAGIPLSDVSKQRLRELEYDEIARTRRLLGRSPKEPPAVVRSHEYAQATASASTSFAVAESSKDASCLRASAAYEVLD